MAAKRHHGPSAAHPRTRLSPKHAAAAVWSTGGAGALGFQLHGGNSSDSGGSSGCTPEQPAPERQRPQQPPRREPRALSRGATLQTQEQNWRAQTKPAMQRHNRPNPNASSTAWTFLQRGAVMRVPPARPSEAEGEAAPDDPARSGRPSDEGRAAGFLRYHSCPPASPPSALLRHLRWPIRCP